MCAAEELVDFDDALGLVVGSGFGLAAVLPGSPVLALSVEEGGGVSDCVTQGPGLNGLLGSSSACARCGVKPMPISTAVGMAASATALPAGMCSLVSRDLRGAACRGPVALLSTSLPAG